MIRSVYTFLYCLLCPFFLILLLRRKSPAIGKRWPELFGQCEPLESKHPIWIHAVSVGEVAAASVLLKHLRLADPEQNILLTTSTPSGAHQAAMNIPWAEHRYMPLDLPFAIRRFLNTTRPRQLLLMETELWPNTIVLCAQANIPVKLINARLSDRSYRHYRLLRPLFNHMTPAMSHVFCQFNDDAQRFIRLGIPPEKLTVTGSLKLAADVPSSAVRQSGMLRQALGTNRPVWIAASTHAGEEAILLAVHRQLLTHFPQVLLILVPRHSERFEKVFRMCLRQGFSVIRRSSGDTPSSHASIYLGDTIGEMLTLTGAADVCFMAGSLLGDKVGGHNIIEPVALGVPAMTGASYYNFQAVVDQLLKANGCIVACNEEDIVRHLRCLLLDPDLRKELANNGSRWLSEQQASLPISFQSVFK